MDKHEVATRAYGNLAKVYLDLATETSITTDQLIKAGWSPKETADMMARWPDMIAKLITAIEFPK